MSLVGGQRARGTSRQVEPSVIGGDGNPLATQLTRRGWTALFVVVGLVGGLFTGAVLGLARGQLSAVRVENEPSASTPIASTGAPAPTPGSPTPPQSSATPPAEMPSPVLAAAAAGEPPDPAVLRAKITSVRVKNANGTYSGSVIDVGTGKVLFGHSSGTPQILPPPWKVLPGPDASDTCLHHEGADLCGRLVDLRARAPVQNVCGEPQGRPSHPGRRW